ncbi:MAG: hypothetical protein Kow006_28270 [Gammaproteobacteria bacterium]
MKAKSIILNSASLVTAFYFGSVVVSVFLVPDDILTNSAILKLLVGGVSVIARGIIRIETYSVFPEVFSFLYAVMISVVPILVLVYLRAIKISELSVLTSAEKRKLLVVSGISVLFFSMLAIIAIVIVPGDPSGMGWTSKIARTMLFTKWGFSLWGCVLTVGMASSIALAIVSAKVLVRLINWK